MANPMFFLIKGNTKLQLPVPPEEFQLQTLNGNQSINVHNLGEINLPGKGKLSKITISSFFPAQDYPFVQVKGNRDPFIYVSKIEDIFKVPNEPFRLVITETKVNGLYLMDGFDYGIVDRTKDVSFSITLTEYRPINYTSTAGGLTSVTGNNSRQGAANQSQQRTYTVIKNDSLWKISKQFYGDGSKYKTIFNANRDKIKNENLIYPGQVLVIP